MSQKACLSPCQACQAERPGLFTQAPAVTFTSFPAGHFPQQQTVARTQEIRFRILLGVFRLKKKERKEKDTFENNNNKKIKRGFVAVSAAYFKTPFPVVL